MTYLRIFTHRKGMVGAMYESKSRMERLSRDKILSGLRNLMLNLDI